MVIQMCVQALMIVVLARSSRGAVLLNVRTIETVEHRVRDEVSIKTEVIY